METKIIITLSVFQLICLLAYIIGLAIFFGANLVEQQKRGRIFWRNMLLTFIWPIFLFIHWIIRIYFYLKRRRWFKIMMDTIMWKHVRNRFLKMDINKLQKFYITSFIEENKYFKPPYWKDAWYGKHLKEIIEQRIKKETSNN